VSQDMPDEYFLAFVMDGTDQAVLISANVEDVKVTFCCRYVVHASERALQFTKIGGLASFNQLEPSAEWCVGIMVSGSELTEPLSRDDVHAA
jgi:hypothetical protein